MKLPPPSFPLPHKGVELFDEFFDSGMEETISPFLTPESRKWGKNLPLKAAGIAALFLLLSFFPLFASSKALLLLFAYFFAGVPALIDSLEDLFTFQINIDVLMTLAAFLSVLIGSAQEGALLLVLFSFSGALEDAVRIKARGALSSLRKIAPMKAYVVESDGRLLERSVRDIALGTPILVKAGEVVPLDGRVIGGASSVNLLHLTGESVPISKKEGDEVQAGSRNLEGALKIAVTTLSSDSTLARIIKLVTEAQEAKPKVEAWLDRFSSLYATTIIALSATLALILPFILKIPFIGVEGSIYRSLAFLIAASPCALIIAVPIAYLSAVSISAKKGVILKGGIVLDALAKCKTIAFDKTGTLTEGKLKCLGIEALDGGDVDEALSYAYALERNALHPIGTAIVAYAESKNVRAVELDEFRMVPGSGLSGKRGEKELFIGNLDYILPKLAGDAQKRVQESIQKYQVQGAVTAVLLVSDKAYIFYFKDTLRVKVKGTLEELKALGLRLIMLSGDHKEVAQAIGKEAGIDEVYGNLRPEEKLEKISEFAKQGYLSMVGDGVNDAPALSRAHVGISMGKMGSRTAVDASDIILLQDNIEILPWLIKKAKLTSKIVRQNLFFALLAIFVATLPALLGVIPLWLAVVLHEGGTCLVGFNALRLLRK